MKIQLNSLNSRIARRIFLTFFASALTPVIVLAALSLFQVSSQLEAQGGEQLRRATKGHGLSILEHLLFCDDELRLLDHRSVGNLERLAEKFNAIGRHYPDGRYESLMGAPIPPIDPTAEQRDHLASGKTLAVVAHGDSTGVFLVRYFHAGDGKPGLLSARVRGDYLWGLEKGNLLPPMSEFMVVDASASPLYHSLDWETLSSAVLPRLNDASTRVDAAGQGWFMASWPLFLEARFGVDSWRLVVLQPEAVIMAPVSRFTYIFYLVLALAMLLVVGLSLFSLRRSLQPIQALKTGARKIAQNDFDHRVQVASGDEFEELAHRFNEMSGQLGQQFRFLSTQEKINNATLKMQDFSHTAGLTISRLIKDFSLKLVAIARINAADPEDELIYLGHADAPDDVQGQAFHIDRKHLDRFYHDLPWLTFDDDRTLRQFMPAAGCNAGQAVTLFPVFVKQRLYALLCIAGLEDRLDTERDFVLMRQIADHLGVAWSNVNLIRDLRRMTIGSMQALARAVDAKSPWTAGHSARVMRIALNIGRHIGFDEERIERLRQAALLHDIGKIGISAQILDKPGKLTEEEFTTIRKHPAIGDTILRPIDAFKDILPMVRHHHERWDGKGYPDGLAGEAIVLEARIMAVADVYDAMASDRPYRKGMPLPKVLGIIQSESGRQFDPAVVSAFMQLMDLKSALAA